MVLKFLIILGFLCFMFLNLLDWFKSCLQAWFNGPKSPQENHFENLIFEKSALLAADFWLLPAVFLAVAKSSFSKRLYFLPLEFRLTEPKFRLTER